ncbi:MAG TPA: hypothetical protein PKY30_15310 [Myxococcota bacterium]|nr:hypothetical protein [Myxococcota bacterium]
MLVPAESPALLPAPLAESALQDLVDTLNSYQKEAGFSFARQVGRLIVDRLYGGDLAAWRSRGPKDSSFQKLAEKSEEGRLVLSASALYRCVALVELEARLGISTWKYLSLSHVRLVFGLPEGDQEKLLIQAEDRQWTVAQMEQQAEKLRTLRKGARGRPRQPAFVKSIGRMKRLLEEDEAFVDLERVAELDPAEAGELSEALRKMQAKCGELLGLLAGREG